MRSLCALLQVMALMTRLDANRARRDAAESAAANGTAPASPVDDALLAQIADDEAELEGLHPLADMKLEVEEADFAMADARQVHAAALASLRAANHAVAQLVGQAAACEAEMQELERASADDRVALARQRIGADVGRILRDAQQ